MKVVDTRGTENVTDAELKPGSAPHDPDVEIQVHIDRGLKFYTSGLVHEAFVEFLQVLAIDPHDLVGHYLCGVSLQALELEEMALNEWAAASSLEIRDGAKWDSDWSWIRAKSTQLINQIKDQSSQSAYV